jgi:hypothetical protein
MSALEKAMSDMDDFFDEENDEELQITSTLSLGSATLGR